MVKRRICIFCEVWASGGIEAFLSSILPLMDRQRLQIDLVAAEIRESVFREPLERIGVRFIELTGNRRRMAENRRRLEKLLREQRYDVFHANLYHGLAFIYIDAARQAGVPIRIAHSHSTALRMDFSCWCEWLSISWEHGFLGTGQQITGLVHGKLPIFCFYSKQMFKSSQME